MADRTTHTSTETRVTHIAKPMGRARANGPHLADLRAFVEACDGLPDDTFVRIENGHLGESGRRDVTISLVYRHPTDEEGEPA